MTESGALKVWHKRWNKTAVQPVVPSSVSLSQNGVVSRFKASSFFLPMTATTEETRMSMDIAFIVSAGQRGRVSAHGHTPLQALLW